MAPLEGLWQLNVGGMVEITPIQGERSKWKGIMRNPTRAQRNTGFRNGDHIYTLNQFSRVGRYEGTASLRSSNGARLNGRIKFNVNPDGRTASIEIITTNRFGGSITSTFSATKIR